MTRSIQACLLILALASLVWAQSAQKDERELWLVRSHNITNDVLKDAADLSSMQRAVLWAKLAQRWWSEDQKRARTWSANAIEVVEQVPNKETEAEREKRLDTARALLTILTPLDQQFTKRLMTVLTPLDKSAQPENNGSADALIDAAITIVKDDPKRAAEIGALALTSGAPDNIDQLLFLPSRPSPFAHSCAWRCSTPRFNVSNQPHEISRGLHGFLKPICVICG
jgi:hypothetical protein